ncbi:MAG: hypothetical protein ABIV47_14795 [Roseiflexaceae bacterium]
MHTRPVADQITTWFWRYLPAELLGTPTALLCAWLAATLTGSLAAAGIAGTWGENLGFYGIMIGRELKRHSLRALPTILRDLILEFGPAEALDSLLLRPVLMYAEVTLVSSTALGIVAGKIAADVCFYVPAIVCYELLCRRPVIEEQALQQH